MTSPSPTPSSTWIGFGLGFWNTLGISAGYMITLKLQGEPMHLGDGLSGFAAFMVVGLPFGLGAGAVIGRIAGHTRELPPGVRLTLFGTLALLVVIFLGLATMLHELIPLAAIPTLVAVSLLERRTRSVAVPPVPTATAVSAS